MLNFNCVTFANIKDIGIVDYKKSSILVFDNISMAELITFSHIQDQDQYFYSAYFHDKTNILYICYDRGYIKLFKLDTNALRIGKSEQEKNQGFQWKCDHQIDKANSINKFFKFSEEYILGLAEKGTIFVYNVSKSDVNRPYAMQMPMMFQDIIDLQKIENIKMLNQYFMCTKNGLYIVKIEIKRTNLIIEIINGEEPDESEIEREDGPVSVKGYLHEDTVRTAVQITPDHLLVACDGRKQLLIIQMDNGKITDRIVNTSQRSTYFKLEKCPGFVSPTKPYVFLKDDRFISVINLKQLSVLRIIKSQCDLSTMRMFNFDVR